MEQYKHLYRAAHDFHARWAPCPADNEWDECCEDMTRTANQHDNNEFLVGVLVAIYEELERAYNAARAAPR